MPIFKNTRLLAWVAVTCLSMLVAQACDSAKFTLGSTDGSGGLVYNGVTYSMSIDDAGNLVITTTDGALFKVDPNGNVIGSTSPGGARINVTYLGDSIDVSSFFPEFENSSRAKTLSIAGEYASQSSPTVCDLISERCDELAYYVNDILPSIHNDLVGYWSGQLGESISNDVINQVVAEPIQQIRARSTNFSPGRHLPLLPDHAPCGAKTDDGGCDFIGGNYVATVISPGDPSREGTLKINLASNGQSATGRLEIRFPPPSLPLLVFEMTGTVRIGTVGCTECAAFEGTSVTNISSNPDGFSILFEKGLKKGEGPYQTSQPGYILKIERTDCN